MWLLRYSHHLNRYGFDASDEGVRIRENLQRVPVTAASSVTCRCQGDWNVDCLPSVWRGYLQYVIFWIPASMKTERCARCVCFTFRKCESYPFLFFFSRRIQTCTWIPLRSKRRCSREKYPGPDRFASEGRHLGVFDACITGISTIWASYGPNKQEMCKHFNLRHKVLVARNSNSIKHHQATINCTCWSSRKETHILGVQIFWALHVCQSQLWFLSLQHFPLLRFGVNSSTIFLAFSRFHRPVHEMNAFDRVRPSAAKMQALQGKQNKKEQELRIT